MDKRRSITYIFGLILLFIEVSLSVEESDVRITNFSVPSNYVLSRNPNEIEPIILDCDFEVEGEGKGFVLKWKHAGLVAYQSIPLKSPVAFSPFKGKVDLQNVVSDSKFHKYRQLKIDEPQKNFTGDYSCSLQTYQGHVEKTNHLQIIVPEADFNLTFSKGNNGSTVVECSVTDIYPKPYLTLSINKKEIEGLIPIPTVDENGNYNAAIQHVLEDDESTEGKEDDEGTEVHCLLTIPGTNYEKSKEDIYKSDANQWLISTLLSVVCLSLSLRSIILNR